MPADRPRDDRDSPYGRPRDDTRRDRRWSPDRDRDRERGYDRGRDRSPPPRRRSISRERSRSREGRSRRNGSNSPLPRDDNDRERLQGQGHLVGGKEEQVLRLLLTVLDFDGISLQIIEILRKGGMDKAIFLEGEDGLEVRHIHILL